MTTYRPQNLNIYVVFDEESDLLGPIFLSLDQVFLRKAYPITIYVSNYAQNLILVNLIVVNIIRFLIITRNAVGISGPY